MKAFIIPGTSTEQERTEYDILVGMKVGVFCQGGEPVYQGTSTYSKYNQHLTNPSSGYYYKIDSSYDELSDADKESCLPSVKWPGANDNIHTLDELITLGFISED